jgi:phosphotransferase system HPr (HPr) family protein
VQAAAKQPVKVTLTAGARTVDARSMLGVLSLGVDKGGEVTLAAEGDGAADAVDALASLLEPMIVIILGVVVGSMVIAMYLPIFKLASVV